MIKDSLLFNFKIIILFILCIIAFNINDPILAEANKYDDKDLKILKSIDFSFPPISTECVQKNMDIPQNVREFVMHKTGYHNVEYVGKWKGYQVYNGIFCDDVVHYRGYPTYALLKNNEIRWTHANKENMEIYHHFFLKNH